MPGKITITVTNEIVFDQRVLRMTGMLMEEGNRVRIVGRYLGSQLPERRIADDTRRFRMLFRKGPLFYLFINARIFLHLLFFKPDLIIAVDLDTMPGAVLASRLRRVKLIYDAHEYFTGVPELLKRPFVRGTWKWIERSVMARTDAMLTVNESLAAMFKEEYGIEACVLRNIPEITGNSVSARSDFGISEEDLILVFQGSVNMRRGLKEAIRAVERINSEIAETDPALFFMIIGSGYELDSIRSEVQACSFIDRYIFLAPMEFNDLMTYTRMADIGLSADDDFCLNYRYSLPNKLFEYMGAGLAVIATSLPEIEKIITVAGNGILMPDNSESEIYKALMELYSKRELLNKLKKNSLNYSANYSWESEKKVLKDFISREAPWQ
ncbi:MAG: glycosyltransferase [Marinilabiliaceae bacterium]|jgi:glycosyltransferase involved in cell wall biosynthesis|nr:glycosyltransferase [Marinilabiliaceae bacterium]